MKRCLRSLSFGMLVLLSCGVAHAEAVPKGGDTDPDETTCASSVAVDPNGGSFEDEFPIPADGVKLDLDTIHTIAEMSKSLPVRPLKDSMMSDIPDLTTPDRISSWLRYVEFRRQMDGQNTKEKMVDAAAVSFGKSSFKDRAVALEAIYDQVAGFVKAEAYPSEITLSFEIPAIGLYAKDGKSLESAEIWTQIKRFAAPLSGASWSPIHDKKMAGGFHYYKWELALDGLPVTDCYLEALTRFDSEFGLPYIQHVRLLQPLTLDKAIPAVKLPKEMDLTELEYGCVKEAANGGDVSPDLHVAHVERGRDEFYCGKDGCKQVIRYGVGMISPEKKADVVEGGIDCRVAVEDAAVVESAFFRNLNYQATSYVQIGVPYGSSSPPNLWSGTPSYGTKMVPLRYAETVGASGSSCSMSNHIGWNDEAGHVTTAASTTPICLIPDSRATNSANNHPSLERFRNCTRQDWAACDGSETEDATLPYSPPLQASASLWAGTDWNRQNASLFYHLNWMHDAVDPLVDTLQCQRNGVNRYTDYKGELVWGGTTSGLGCAMILGNSEYDSTVPTLDAPQTAHHEYAHVMQGMNQTKDGGVRDRGNVQCRSTLGPDQNGQYTVDWFWRQIEGVPEGIEDILTAFETVSQNRLNQNTYPGDSGQTQLAGTYHYLSWLIGWDNTIRAMFKDTGLRHYNGDPCTGGILLSGMAARDTRQYLTLNGTNNTANCACYHANNPCGCAAVPGQLSERENASKALCLSGPTWLHHEVDRTFNARSTETGERWTDDVTNIWFAGPYISRPNTNLGEGSTIYFSDAPDRTGTYLSTSSLPYGEWDYDIFSFFPGWAQSYYVSAHSVDGRNLRMEIVDRDRTQIAYNDNCNSNTLDPCITQTFYDANSHYIRVWDDVGGSGRYTLEFRQIGDDHNNYEPEATALPLSQNVYMNGLIHANDVDYFRVFVPNNSVYSTTSLPISTCSNNGLTLRISLFNSAVDSSGRFRNNTALATYYSSATCSTFDTNSYSLGGTTLPQGWYFIKVEADSAGSQAYYRIKAGTAIAAGISSATTPIPLSSYWDTMYNDTTSNRIFHGAGVISSTSYPDWYLLNLSGMEGRMVTIDVLGMDNGSGGTHFNPMVELYSGLESASDNGYYNSISVSRI